MRLTYAIKFVGDMDQSIRFYRDRLGLTLKFQSPSWSEFVTGETTLALHLASAENPPGTVQLGFAIDHLDRFYDEGRVSGISFTSPPQDVHGTKIARFLDAEGSEVSISERS